MEQALVVREDKKTLAKIWDKVVRSGVKMPKIKLKATPALLKIASVFVPEIAPIAIPLSKFVKSLKNIAFIIVSAIFFVL